MDLKQHVYSVLIVSGNQKFGEQLSAVLSGNYQPVETCGSVNQAQRKLSERSYDIVLINTPLPDDFGVRFASDISATEGTVVLIFVKSEFYEQVREKVEKDGVFVLRKPSAPPILDQSFDWLRAMRERLRRMERKSLTLQEKMEEIKLINRAKMVLITHLNMTEEAAHRYIEKQAMDRCVSKRAIAQTILQTYKE